MKQCHVCKKEVEDQLNNCPGCGALIDPTQLPEGIKGWSWGAFTLTWIWAIGNKTWIGLLALIPYVSFVMAFVLGFKGREWAWKNNKWDSVEHFNRVQKKWSFWGLLIVGGLTILGIILAIIIPILMAAPTLPSQT